jgi:predicted transposase YbfD/YdcC
MNRRELFKVLQNPVHFDSFLYSKIRCARPDITTRNDWAGLTHIGKVTCERWIQGEYQQETRYYILHRVETAKKLAEASRGHWGMENSVHWSLDVTFHEDDICIYAGYGAENLATVRKIAPNALKQEKTRS